MTSHYTKLFPLAPSVHTGRMLRPILSTRSAKKVGDAVGIIVVDEEERLKMLEAGKSRYPGREWFYAHKPGSPGLRSACGECRLGELHRCYVQNNVQNASQPGAAIFDEEFDASIRRAIFKAGWIRSAIAGDVGSLPYESWLGLRRYIESCNADVKWLGYTHNPDAEHLRGTHVLSVEVDGGGAMYDAGWRTFKSIDPGTVIGLGGEIHLREDEFLCPASNEAAAVRGRKLTCEQCGACTGTARLGLDKPQGVIARHGMGDTQQIVRSTGLRIYDHRGRLVGKKG